MKYIKMLASIAVLFAAVIAVSIGTLYLFINPNKLKPVLAAELAKHTGYDVLIDGEFKWAFYPRIGIKADHIALYVPKQQTPFVDLKNITFVTDMLELLQGNQKLLGDVYVAEIKLLNVSLTHVHVGVHWREQILSLQPIAATMYAGTLSGAIQGSQLAALPKWEWDLKLEDAALAPLMQQLNDSQSKLRFTGVANLSMQATTQGKNRDMCLGSLNGKLVFDLKQGTIEGIDINHLLQAADAMIRKQSAPVLSGISQTVFERLTGSMIIKNGVAATNDLILQAPTFKTSGAGSLNLVFESINMQLRVAPTSNATTQWVIPIMITGNLYQPDARLDVTEINIMIAKDKLDKIRAKMDEEVRKHLSGKTGTLLQNILGS